MGTLGRTTRNGKKKVPARRVERTKEPHPAIGKLAVALNQQKELAGQQAATAEILRIITSSPGDQQAVFDAILKSAMRLCAAHLGLVNTWNGSTYRTVAQRGAKGAFAKWLFDRGEVKPLSYSGPMPMIREKRPVHFDDLSKSEAYRKRSPAAVRFVEDGGVRTYLAVPLLKGGEVIGFIVLYRPEVHPFTDRQIGLVQTFADQAVIAIENARLFNETKEALERQTATADILRVISRSPTNVQPVLDAVAERATTLCRADNASVFLAHGKVLRRAAVFGSHGGIGEEYPITRGLVTGRTFLDRKTIHVEDIRIVGRDYPDGRPSHRRFGFRSAVCVPLLRDAEAIGVIMTWRGEVRPFSPEQISLLQTFADQAVIAIENVRLFNQTKEALEQQTASSEVLGVISSSPTDLAPVFDAILASATRLCDAHLGLLNLREDDKLRTVAQRGGAPEFVKWVSERGPFKPSLAIAMETRQPIQIPDITETPAFKAGVEMAVKFLELGGARTYLTVPLLKDETLLGSISIYRPEVRPFTDKQIELVKTFANQAVIAIENVRLFTELRARNDDLRISLEQQTATSELLKVIGRSTFELRPVFETLAENAVRLCEAERAVIFRFDGQLLRFAAGHNVSPELLAFFEAHPIPPGRNSNAGRAALERRTIHNPDVLNDPEYTYGGNRVDPYRTVLAVPMLKAGEVLGVILIYRHEVRLFSDSHIALMETFADQAVIAVENVRLFNETKEALEQQTATAEILRVMSSSPDDIQPVFASILEHAMRLCDAGLGTVGLYDGKTYTHVAQRGGSSEYVKWLFSEAFEPSAASTLGRMIAEQRPVHIPDYRELAAYRERNPRAVATVELGGARTYLAIPLLREGRVLGGITIRRAEVRPFTQRQIDLVSTFANQAVIAIENVRLFNETKEALEHQQTSADILRIVSQSVADSQPAFEAILAAARRLFPGFDSTVWRVDKDRLVAVARGGPTMSSAAGHGVPITPEYVHGIAILERRPVRLDDVESSPEISETSRQDLLSRNRRAILMVPFVRDGDSIGAISVSRSEPYRFSEKHVALLQAFASQAVIAIENARLFNETREALERQTATAEILKVIASSPTEVQPVFDVIVERAVRLCGASFGRVYRYDGSTIHMVASHGLSAAGLGQVQRVFPRPASDDTIVGRVILARRPNFLQDIERDQTVPPLSRQMIQALNTRSQVTIPMLRAGQPIGAITLGWDKPSAFNDQQVALLQAFADQAVIAVENVRLFNETKESLEQQTATADILKVISQSPTATQPVFDAIVQSAARLFAPSNVVIVMREGEVMQRKARAGSGQPDQAKLASIWPLPFDPERSMAARSIIERRVIEIPDTEAEGLPPIVKTLSAAAGYRAIALVPLIREGEGIGVIAFNRPEPGFKMTEKQLALVRTFADQAVIAIENVRLFNETKEALEQQTAISEILGVISSSPTDVQPVFDAVLKSATRLCEAHLGVLNLYDGERVRTVAQRGGSSEFAKWTFERGAFKPDGEVLLQVIAERRPVQAADMRQSAGYLEGRPNASKFADLSGARTFLAVPLLKDEGVVGNIGIYRSEVRPFSDKQTALVSTFANQAVIAIENVRLFNETKESLEKQTATAEILNVISRSPTDVRPVFDTIVRSAIRLMDGRSAGLFTFDGVQVHLGSAFLGEEDRTEAFRDYPAPIEYNVPSILAIKECRVVNVADMWEGDWPNVAKDRARISGYRASLAVPMLRGGKAIGSIAVTRSAAGQFAEHHVTLLKTFADQAVIAIENVRLFKELQERTEALTKSVGQLTALGEVGQAISSTLDLETVLKTIVARAVQLTGLDGGSIYEYDEPAEEYHLRATENYSAEVVEVLRRAPIRRNEGPVWQAGVTGQPTQIAEMRDESYQTPRREFLLRTGYRALLVVPLMRENRIVGALTVTRKAPGAFAPEVVELLKTFATQSALAIQNARLFREIAEKGKQLEVASEHKSHFLASMSHELRTPLNALLGFNEMLLGGIYGEVPGDMNPPLAQMQASGKHLLRLINNVLDLAKIEAGRMELALAEYSVHDTVESVRSTLQPLAVEKGLDFLAAVPSEIPLAYGDPGRIAQCLMNLAGNSLKFTKSGKVEISVAMDDGVLRYRVVDTGIGIPPDKIEGLFTEFKQTDATVASEYGGTGLGLSISKKFVEMHGGRIWAESEPGRGSVFTFEVPLRAKAP